jgi:WD40 repeat protein
VFLTPKQNETAITATVERLRNPASRLLADDSRRSSFSGVTFRPRLPSHATSTGDNQSLTELRRKLTRLDDTGTSSRDLAVNSPMSTKPGVKVLSSSLDPQTHSQTAHSNASGPSTLQDRASGSLHTRNRLSFGRDAAKAAPAISATNEVASGRLEVAAMLGVTERTASASGLDTPRQVARDSHSPPGDPLKPFTSTYEGHDPNILALLERTYVENLVFGLSHLGPHVEGGQSIRRGLPNRSKQSSRGGDQTISLIAHLSTHQSAVIQLLASPDLLYLVSVEQKGLVCIWDVSRFERSVTMKPRLSHQFDRGNVTAVCALTNRSAFAFAFSDGSIHLLRISHPISSSLKQARILPAQKLTHSREHGDIISLHNVQQSRFNRMESRHLQFFWLTPW